MVGNVSKPVHGFIELEAIVMSTKTPQQVGGVTNRANRLFKKRTQGKTEVGSFLTFAIVMAGASCLTLFPLMMDTIIGEATAVDDTPRNVFASIMGYAVIDICLVMVGVLLVRAVNSPSYVEVPSAKNNATWLGYLIKMVIAYCISIPAKLLIWSMIAVFSVVLVFCAIVHPIVYFGFAYAETNKNIAATKIESATQRVERLQARYDFAVSINCMSKGTSCEKTTRPADDIEVELNQAVAERLALFDDNTSSKGGMYPVILAVVKPYYPQATERQLVTARGFMWGIVGAFGTIISMYILSVSYCRTHLMAQCRREIERGGIVIEGDFEEEHEPRLRMTTALGNLIGHTAHRAALGVQTLAQVARPSVKVASHPAQVCSTGVQGVQEGVQGVKHTNTDDLDSVKEEIHTPAHPVKPTLDRGTVQNLDNCAAQAAQDVCTLVTPVQHSVQPVQSVQPVANCADTEQDCAAPVQPSLVKAPVRSVQAVQSKSDDDNIAGIVRAQHPHYTETCNDSGLMGAIRKAGKEFNRGEGRTSIRIGEVKAKRIFKQLTGRDYIPA